LKRDDENGALVFQTFVRETGGNQGAKTEAARRDDNDNRGKTVMAEERNSDANLEISKSGDSRDSDGGGGNDSPGSWSINWPC
jgi:hypothetical protein